MSLLLALCETVLASALNTANKTAKFINPVYSRTFSSELLMRLQTPQAALLLFVMHTVIRFPLHSSAPMSLQLACSCRSEQQFLYIVCHNCVHMPRQTESKYHTLCATTVTGQWYLQLQMELCVSPHFPHSGSLVLQLLGDTSCQVHNTLSQSCQAQSVHPPRDKQHS